MPDARPVPEIQPVDFESSPLRLAQDFLTTQEALTLVKDTFFRIETWRKNNHDVRWTLHDRLYFGVVPQEVWDGTNVAKASLASYMIFSQVENAMPALMEGLFGQDDWFNVTPEPGATVQEARAIEAHLRYVFNHSRSEYGTTEEEFESAIRQMLKYGNGGLMLEWDATKARPVIQFVDIRDVYIDIGLNSPAIDNARNVIYRTEMTLDELEAYRSDDRMSIPAKDQLVYMTRNRPSALADQTKRQTEINRNVNFVPGVSDTLPLPADNRIEVLIYYSKSRIIWVLNREWVAFNDENPYGFIPFCFAPCFTVESRFYAQGYADVLEPAQQYTAKLRNARLDWLSLAMNPPRVRKRGPALPPSKLKIHPGLVDEVAEPKNDVIFHSPTNDPTANTEEEIAHIGIDAEKITGSNSVAQGVPRPGNVNRTKGGVDSQIAAAASRLALIGRHVERYLMVPLLYKMYRMIQLNTQPGTTLPALGPEDKFFEVGGDAFQAPVKFRMVGPSRMMTQGKLAQVVPFVFQYLANPAIMQPLNKLGYNVDFMELAKMVQDATGVSKHYQVIRPLTPQEQQALAQPDTQQQIEMMKLQGEWQNRKELTQLKGQFDLQDTQLEGQFDLQEAQIGKDDPMVAKMEADIKIQELTQKLRLKEEEHRMKMMQMQQKHQLELAQLQQRAHVEMQTSQMELQSSMMQAQAQHQMDMQLNEQSHEQELRHGDEAHKQGLQQGQQQHGLKYSQREAEGKQKLRHTDALGKQKLETEKHKRTLLGSDKPKKKPAKK